MMRIILVIFSLSILAGLALGGCVNTVDGAGKDIEKAGQAIQKQF